MQINFISKLLPKRRRRSLLPAWQAASRHPFAVPVLTFVSLLLLSAIGFGAYRTLGGGEPVKDARVVIIAYDHQRQVVPSRERTVGALLKHLDIAVRQGDVVEPAMSTTIDQDDFRINIYRALPVQVVDGARNNFAFSAATTPRSIAAQTNTKVYPEDVVKTEPVSDFVRSGAIGQQVVIKRATAVNLNLYGTAVAVRTQAQTVGQLMVQKNITLAKDDQVLPSADTVLTPDTQVFIVRNGTKIESVTSEIAMPIQTINDPNLAYGTNAVRQQGSPGRQVVTYQNTLKNDQVVSRTAIQTVVTQQPVTQIVVIGTSLSGIKGDMALAGISPSDYQYVDYIISHESGWCPTKAQGQYGGCPAYAGSVPSTGGYGLCQSTPGSKMASAGADWATNPVTQLRWCSNYAAARYGSWAAAYNHWLVSHNW